LGCSGSFTEGSVSSTSAIRSPDTNERGRKTNIMVIIMKAMTTWKAYCKKAIMSPTWMKPWST